jgi:hypothetical protein
MEQKDECWSIGVMGIHALAQYSITPTFYYSISLAFRHARPRRTAENPKTKEQRDGHDNCQQT